MNAVDELPDLRRCAGELGLDVERFWDNLCARTHAPRVAEDVDKADASRLTGTPSLFVNGRRHDGAYDIDTLAAPVRAAHARAIVAHVRND